MRQARERFSELIDNTRDGQVTIITRNGRQAAAVVPMTLLQEYRRWEEQHLLGLISDRADEDSYLLSDVLAETLARPA